MPKLTVAVVAPGEMGSAIGAALTANGARVLTSLAGRSATSIARARKAGFDLVETDDQLVRESDFLMSVVPPNVALDLATRLAPALKRATNKPVYIDCNAISPQAVKRIESVVEPTGCKFLDGGLFGGPTSGKPGVVLYVSGANTSEAIPLGKLGLSVRVIKGEIGAASAMKLSFAALNKGFTALGVLGLLGAIRSSSQEALMEQLSETQPGILAYVSRFVPAMFPKAYRWAPEMEEIAAFLHDDPEASDVFLALARLYRRVARDVTPVERGEVVSLRAFCKEATEVSAGSVKPN